MTRDEFLSLLGEGMHTAFRKAVDTSLSATVWRAIDAMPAADWAEILAFVADGMPDEMFQPTSRDETIAAEVRRAVDSKPRTDGERAAFEAGARFARALYRRSS